MGKGDKLNLRVWKLFEDAGFRTFPNSRGDGEYEVQLSPRKKIPVDLYARHDELDVTIIGSNKSGNVSHWTEHVNSYETLGQKAKADRVLFVITGHDLADEEREEVRERGMCIWGAEELSYYGAVVDAIGEYAKYEIIHALGLKTREEKQTHKVLAMRLAQPTSRSATELFMFTVPPEHLLKTCVVYRRAQGNSAAYQRMLRRKRLPRIQDFVTRPDSLLPTDIIAHLSEKVTIDQVELDELKDSSGRPITLSRSRGGELVVLNIPMEYASLELIDGQHRLYGFVKTDAATKKEFNLVVLGIKGMSPKQRRETFVAINDNSRRMDPNLVAYLKYTTDDAECKKSSELMAIRIVVDLNKTTPLKDAIRLLDVSSRQRITLKGFSGYDLRGLLGAHGLLRKYYPANSPQEYLGVLRMYFSTIRSLFHKEWKNPEKYILATNKGISAHLKLLRSILKTERGPITHEIVSKYLGQLKSKRRLWQIDKLQKTYVGSQGWKDFHRDLVAIIKKKYAEFIE